MHVVDCNQISNKSKVISHQLHVRLTTDVTTCRHHVCERESVHVVYVGRCVRASKKCVGDVMMVEMIDNTGCERTMASVSLFEVCVCSRTNTTVPKAS